MCNKLEEKKEFCEECQDWFPVDEEGEINCKCDNDPYLNDPSKELDFNE